MDSQDPNALAKPSFFRAFLPFWVTASLSLAIFCTEYHRRNAPLTVLSMQVTVDGAEPEEGYSLTLNGRSADPSRPVGLGPKTIVVSTPYTEPVSLKQFVWYGPNLLGPIELKRSQVKVALDVQPRPELVELRGPSGSFTNATGQFGPLPAGRYDATFRYGELTDVQRVRVVRDLPEPLKIISGFGSLELSFEPADAVFKLATRSSGRTWEGTTPGGIPRLPKGGYILTVARGEYRRSLDVTVQPNETNRMHVKFVYGILEATSEPTGATVVLGGNVLGRTPLVVSNVIPARYRLEITKPGFDAGTSEVEVEEGGSRKVATRLVNTRYREALAAAKAATGNGRQREALRYLTTALEEQAQDVAVMVLLPGVRRAARLEESEDLAHRGLFAEAIASLDQADKSETQDPEATALRTKIAQLKAQADQQTATTKAREALDDAKRAASARDINRALTRLADAKRLVPDLAGIAETEQEILRTKADLDAETARRQRAAQITTRLQELETAFARVQTKDKYPDSFITGAWRTTRPVQDVLSTIEALDRSERAGKISELSWLSDHHATIKAGALVPLVDIGTYVRIATATIEDGRTEIRAKVFTYQFGDQGPVPDSNPEHQRLRLEDLRSKFDRAFSGDLKPANTP